MMIGREDHAKSFKTGRISVLVKDKLGTANGIISLRFKKSSYNLSKLMILS